jgi:GSH-dependent disulfide-bond oxidoreductase
VTEWLLWQVGGLGPMAGQNHHFGLYALNKIPYAIDRYVKETNRLYGVLDRHLENRPFIAGDGYSIADMASYPWIVPWKRQQQDLDEFPNLRRWFDVVRQRPGTQRAYARSEPYSNRPTVTEKGKKILLGNPRTLARSVFTSLFNVSCYADLRFRESPLMSDKS